VTSYESLEALASQRRYARPRVRIDLPRETTRASGFPPFRAEESSLDQARGSRLFERTFFWLVPYERSGRRAAHRRHVEKWCLINIGSGAGFLRCRMRTL